tara:strand:- start:2623 stop:3561 length:939 start_codon:yes stop_codon:yes gene_type:complete
MSTLQLFNNLNPKSTNEGDTSPPEESDNIDVTVDIYNEDNDSNEAKIPTQLHVAKVDVYGNEVKPHEDFVLIIPDEMETIQVSADDILQYLFIPIELKQEDYQGKQTSASGYISDRNELKDIIFDLHHTPSDNLYYLTNLQQAFKNSFLDEGATAMDESSEGGGRAPAPPEPVCVNYEDGDTLLLQEPFDSPDVCSEGGYIVFPPLKSRPQDPCYCVSVAYMKGACTRSQQEDGWWTTNVSCFQPFTNQQFSRAGKRLIEDIVFPERAQRQIPPTRPAGQGKCDVWNIKELIRRGYLEPNDPNYSIFYTADR